MMEPSDVLRNEEGYLKEIERRIRALESDLRERKLRDLMDRLEALELKIARTESSTVPGTPGTEHSA